MNEMLRRTYTWTKQLQQSLHPLVQIKKNYRTFLIGRVSRIFAVQILSSNGSIVPLVTSLDELNSYGTLKIHKGNIPARNVPLYDLEISPYVLLVSLVNPEFEFAHIDALGFFSFQEALFATFSLSEKLPVFPNQI